MKILGQQTQDLPTLRPRGQKTWTARSNRALATAKPRILSVSGEAAYRSWTSLSSVGSDDSLIPPCVGTFPLYSEATYADKLPEDMVA